MMTRWYESHIDRQIREAQERGEFDNLPGAGRPLPGYGEPDDEDWWLKQLIRRENITGVLPASLKLRREIEDIAQTVAKKKTEAAVRKAVEDLNERIGKAQRGHLDGPPVVLSTVDVDAVVARWRSAQAGGQRQ